MAEKHVSALLCALSVCSCTSEGMVARSCSEPLAHWRTPGKDWPSLIANRVGVAQQGTLTWNGASVTPEQLRRYLQIVPTMNPPPPVVLTVDPQADCRAVADVRHEIDTSLNCAETGICGEGSGDWLKRFPQ
jgi:hypothetical protein